MAVAVASNANVCGSAIDLPVPTNASWSYQGGFDALCLPYTLGRVLLQLNIGGAGLL